MVFGGSSGAFSTPGNSLLFSTSGQASSSSSKVFGSSKDINNTFLRNNGTEKNGSSSNQISRPDQEGSKSEEMIVETCYLDPPAFKRKEKEKWSKGGRTLLACPSPVGGELAAWISKKPGSDPNKEPKLSDPKLSRADQTIFFTSPTVLPDPLITLYTETYTLFTSLQRIVAASLRLPVPGAGLNGRGLGVAEVWDKKGNLVNQGLLGPPGAETVGHMRRLVGMYLEEIVRLKETKDVSLELKVRFEAVYHIFHLAQLLYLPQDGRGEGLLGEELLDWVNDVDPAPDNSQGNEIMQTREPWDHPSFWPYITRCLLRGFQLPASSFLRTLSNHPHQPISKLASLLSSHLSLFPRSHNTAQYPLDHQFLSAHKNWLSKFRAEIAVFSGGKPKGQWLDEEGESRNKWTQWEQDFRAVIELMEGKAERVLSEAADWREAVGAWGVLVDPGLRRDDLPKAMNRIMGKFTLDETALDDTVQASLCQANIVTALMGCNDLDVWLAAHLGDVFDKLAMIPDDEERDYLLLEYAEILQENPNHVALWRIICDYLAAAGDEGRSRLQSHILHVSLGLQRPKVQDRSLEAANGSSQESNGMEVEEHTTGKEDNTVEARFEHFSDVREACIELRLEDEWKMISRIMADRLIRQGEYGLAATMCLQAEDGLALSEIASKIVDGFVQKGPEEFLQLVDTLPPTLLNEAPAALAQLESGLKTSMVPLNLPNQAAVSVFAARLAFLSEFRDYLLFLTQGAKEQAAGKLITVLTSGIAPIEIWAVLLAESVLLLEDVDILFSSNDTFEILRILEEVASNSTYAPAEYLFQLILYLKRTSADDQKTSLVNGDGKQAKSSSVSVHASKAETEEILKSGLKEAQRKLEEVRLAVARNLSRALVMGFDNPF